MVASICSAGKSRAFWIGFAVFGWGHRVLVFGPLFRRAPVPSTSILAEQLYLSASTVKTHMQRLYEKLGVNGQAAAVAEAMRRGLLE